SRPGGAGSAVRPARPARCAHGVAVGCRASPGFAGGAVGGARRLRRRHRHPYALLAALCRPVTTGKPDEPALSGVLVPGFGESVGDGRYRRSLWISVAYPRPASTPA